MLSVRKRNAIDSFSRIVHRPFIKFKHRRRIFIHRVELFICIFLRRNVIYFTAQRNIFNRFFDFWYVRRHVSYYTLFEFRKQFFGFFNFYEFSVWINDVFRNLQIVFVDRIRNFNQFDFAFASEIFWNEIFEFNVDILFAKHFKQRAFKLNFHVYQYSVIDVVSARTFGFYRIVFHLSEIKRIFIVQILINFTYDYPRIGYGSG